MKQWVFKFVWGSFLFSLSFISFSEAQAGWWKIPEKPTQRVLRQKLEAYTGALNVHTNQNTIDVTLVYEFGEGDTKDRVWLEAPAYSDINGLEVFSGTIRSVAIDEGDWKHALADLKTELASDIFSRVEFFPSHLSKSSFKPPGGREYIDIQTQSFFADDSKTFVFDFDARRGLTSLELDKVYSRPAELIVKYSESPSNGDSVHPRYHRLHFAVLVKEQADEIIDYKKVNANSEIEPHMSVQRKNAVRFYQPFVNELRQSRQTTVLTALEELVKNQNATVFTQKDVRNLMIIDAYLAKSYLTDSTVKMFPLPTQAGGVRAALDVRLLMFGAEPQDVWVFQFDPLMQQTERDFAAFYPQSEWRGRSNRPDAKAAFIHTSRGSVVLSTYLRDVQINENLADKELLRMTLVYPDAGYALAEFGELRIPVHRENIGRQALLGVKKGIQGNGDYFKYMLEDIINERLTRSCVEIFRL